MRLDLKKRLFLSFSLVILVLGLLTLLIGTYLISTSTVKEAQTRVRLDLRAAWEVYQETLDDIRDALLLLSAQHTVRAVFKTRELGTIRKALEEVRLERGWDVLTVVDPTGRVLLRTRNPYTTGDDQSADAVVRQALNGEQASGTVIVPRRMLELEGQGLAKQAFMVPEPTPKAKPGPDTLEISGMMLKAAVPVFDAKRNLLGAIYGGILLNRNYDLVDRVKDIVFKDDQYKGRDLGTVTIFQRDLRIATNVKKPDGSRAIGTRVSAEVYDQVLEKGRAWYDRAFVVNDWYLTAYDPIRNPYGAVIGIFYVGILEQKYKDLRNEILFTFLGITLLGVVAVLGVSYGLAHQLSRPLRRLAQATQALSHGKLDYRVEVLQTDDEIHELTLSFNKMAEALHQREKELRVTNQHLQTLNHNYLDMLGFVSHELKNPLASCMMNGYSLRDQILGELNPRQRKAIESIVRNLEYFQSMIKNYLDLSRIEKGELEVHKQPVRLYAEVIAPVIQGLERQIEEMRMHIENELPAEDVVLSADPDLLTIVYDNLIENALKYGKEGGRIVLGAKQEDDHWRLHVWNEGPGIAEDQLPRLFKKFSRIERPGLPRKKGTGLGLFVTKEIIERHGGAIWAESEEGAWINFVFTLPKN